MINIQLTKIQKLVLNIIYLEFLNKRSKGITEPSSAYLGDLFEIKSYRYADLPISILNNILIELANKKLLKNLYNENGTVYVSIICQRAIIYLKYKYKDDIQLVENDIIELRQ